ncbi:hypothetical protein B0J14DRAFT_237862 [Halenospora varia]|nr:hypothetical protein B0J14DRAFT_237862 [Halenospora varia]
MASGRPTRSRYSSPFVNTNNNGVSGSSKAVADAAERPKTMLDKWVEPQLAKPKASFEEAGFARGGTVMNMAPLGTMPSAKVRKNAERAEALDGAGRVRRSETSNATTPETPEPPPVVARRRSLSTKAEDAELSPKTPQAQTSPQKSAQKTNPNPQKIGQSVFSLSDAPLPVPTPPTLLAPSYLPQPSPKPYVSVYQPQPTPPILQDVDPESGINLERTDKVVEHAVQVALDHRRYPTAYALRILYDEVRDKPDVVKVIEDIYSGHPKESQLHLFAGLMKEKKLEGKKDRTGEYYFNGDGSDPPPRLPFSAVKTALTYDVPSERPNSGGNLFNDSARRASLSFSIAGSPIDSLPFFKKQKTTHISPYPPLENGVPTRPLTLPGSNNSTSLALPTRERRDSETSESSLSSVDEDLINTEVLSPEKKKRTTNNSSKSNSNSNHVGVGGGDAQTRLASANNKTSDNSSGPAPAEAQGHNSTSQPIAAPPKNGPKTYTFSTVTSTSTSTSTPTPTSTSTLSSSQPHANSNSDMAPAALLPALSTSSSMPFINSHKAKNAFKGQGRFEPENENRVRLKRAAREKTNISSNPPESFERFQPPVDVETASESGDIPPAPSRRPTKRRTLNNREAKNRYNGDSEDLSSPTLLSFQPDIAPGSVSTSRAGTPNAANRPTRRAKTGSGLRVKTS